MLRSIRSTTFLAILLLAGTAVAKPKAPAAASDDDFDEGGKAAKTATNARVPAEAAPAPAAAPAPVAVPAPPAAEDEGEAAPAQAAAPKKARTLTGTGLDTQTVTTGGVTEAVESTTAEKDWGFKFKGFFRGPMRVGVDPSGNLTPGSLQFHSPPAVPDGNYTRWTYTNINPGPWAELLFQYGNQVVMMTTSIASYNITSGGWRELQDQLGIDRAFLTLKFPEALGNVGGMAWDVGVFSNRYGAMGKYDAGEYETYLIARTRIAGATATADLDVSDDFKVVVETGAGAKMDQQYQTYTGTTPTYDYPSWMPYPGQNVQNGTNLLFHLHVGAVIGGILTTTLHYVDSWVQDARWNVASTGGSPNARPSYANNPTDGGSIQIFGLDAKLDGGWIGDGYLGVSYLKGRNVGAVSDSIEVLHSQGGWQLAQNYFPDGNGNILSVAGQYTFSVAGFMMRPRPFWGQAADVTIRPFFMYNKVSGTTGGTNDLSKLKFGIDAIYSFLPTMAVGFRGDLVQPNMSDSTQSFAVLSPKLIFRSEFVTHEMIVLQFSKYLYGSGYNTGTSAEKLMPWPYGTYGTWDVAKECANPGTASCTGSPPDSYVISLSASMWW